MGGRIQTIRNFVSHLTSARNAVRPEQNSARREDRFTKSEVSPNLLPRPNASYPWRYIPEDILTGERLRTFNQSQRERDPLMRLGKKELEKNPEILQQVVAESVVVAEKFSEELTQAMKEIGLRTKIKGGEKQPSRILEKLERKTREKGSEQALADMVDLAKCRIETETFLGIYHAAEKVKQMYGDRILEWDDLIANRRANGFIDGIHIAILSEDGNRKLELQITTQDIIKLEHERFQVMEGFVSNFHDLIYKGLGRRDPEVVREFYDIHQNILDLNLRGERLESDKELQGRIQALREKVIGFYHSTPRAEWPRL